MKSTLKIYRFLPAMTLACAAIILPALALAQTDVQSPDVPIDGGLTLLIAAGAAYGVKKYRDHKRKGEEETDLK